MVLKDRRHQVPRTLNRIGLQRLLGPMELIRSPYDDEPVGEVSVASTADMDQAIANAAAAFQTTRTWPIHQRAALLSGTAQIIERHRESLATLMARESGKPIRFCRPEVDRAALTFELGASVVRTWHGETIPLDLDPRGEGALCVTKRCPRGPVAAISPFNFPLNLLAHKLSPAFAVGASVVVKPAPQCPLTAFRLGELLDDAGLAPEALSILHCPPAVAQRMVEDDRMAVLSFTGSDKVGWKLKSLAGRKQVLLELGGNAPCIIDKGVPVDDVVESILTGAWAHAGQICIKVQRILVHHSTFAEFLERFVERTMGLPCGDPLDPRTVIGPLIDRAAVERVLDWVGEATAKGAKMLCGGEVAGNVMNPIVLTEVDPSLRVWCEEVFGPVTIVEPFCTFEEAIEICNAGRFGLQVGVFTHQISNALLAFRELEYGGVLIGDVPTFRVDNVPYGGTKDSGFGREGVRYAMEELTEPKMLIMRG